MVRYIPQVQCHVCFFLFHKQDFQILFFYCWQFFFRSETSFVLYLTKSLSFLKDTLHTMVRYDNFQLIALYALKNCVIFSVFSYILETIAQDHLNKLQKSRLSQLS